MSALRLAPDDLTLDAALAMIREANARLAAKIEGAGDCWLWTASIDSCGYGRFGVKGSNRLAHRVVYELLIGPIPEGLTLDHCCRNRRCVNPAHLEPVSLRENVLRGEGIGVRNATKTHCRHGHEFTPENTYMKHGKRNCRECGRQANRRFRAKATA